MSIFTRFATDRFRWWALAVLSLGLAIVVIDNTVLNVAIPYILRDLNTNLESIQWVISGYALIIATVLIFMGRLGDIIGRKKVFLLGTVLFAGGSLLASFAQNPNVLFIGEAVIEALGAAAMLTSSLSLLAGEFQGKERAVAFGVWGSVAGASASIGPLLGGYFTTYHSWRWALRINVFVAIATIIGSIFVQESKGSSETKSFDWGGIILSGFGMFSLVFGFIEGQKYGWWKSDQIFKLGTWQWPWPDFSIIPVAFILAAVFLFLFVLWEIRVERLGGTPVLKMSLLRRAGFSFSLITTIIVSLGQFGIFFILPLYFQNVLGLTALKTGVAFLYVSVTFMVFGAFSGFLTRKLSVKWVVTLGMFISVLGVIWLIQSLKADVNYNFNAIGPALILFGIGGGMATAQLTNLVLSSVPLTYAGEASAASATMRQVGTSIGIAILGTILVTSLLTNVKANIQKSEVLSDPAKSAIVGSLNIDAIESGHSPIPSDNLLTTLVVQDAVKHGLTDAAKKAIWVAMFFLLVGAGFSLLIPNDPAEKSTPGVPATPTPPSAH